MITIFGMRGDGRAGSIFARISMSGSRCWTFEAQLLLWLQWHQNVFFGGGAGGVVEIKLQCDTGIQHPSTAVWYVGYWTRGDQNCGRPIEAPP